MRTHLFRTGAVTAAAVAALLLGGCAGAQPDDASAGSDAQDADGLTPLRVVIAPVINEPFYYGIDNGVFEEYGLDVSTVPGGILPAQQVPVLLSGEADIAMVGAVTLMAGVSEGLPVQAIHAMLNSVPPEDSDSGFIVAPGSGITGWGDLDHTTIAVPGLNEKPQLAIEYAVDTNGGDSSTIEFVEMPITNMNDAVRNGQIDGALQISTFYSQAVAEGFGTLGDPAAQYFEGSPTIQLMATVDWIDANQETLEKLNAALADIMATLNADQSLIREVQRQYTELPPAVIDAAIMPTYSATYDRQAYERALELAFEYGFLQHEVSYDDVVWSGAPQQ